MSEHLLHLCTSSALQHLHICSSAPQYLPSCTSAPLPQHLCTSSAPAPVLHHLCTCTITSAPTQHRCTSAPAQSPQTSCASLPTPIPPNNHHLHLSTSIIYFCTWSAHLHICTSDIGQRFTPGSRCNFGSRWNLAHIQVVSNLGTKGSTDQMPVDSPSSPNQGLTVIKGNQRHNSKVIKTFTFEVIDHSFSGSRPNQPQSQMGLVAPTLLRKA
jgi:hypothetical protein